MFRLDTSLIVLFFALGAAGSATAESPHGAAHGAAHDEHAAASNMQKDGALTWSYTGRERPVAPSQRWEMVPQPGNSMMFVVADSEACAKLAAAPRVMAVDRATRQACGLQSAPASAAPPATPHQH